MKQMRSGQGIRPSGSPVRMAVAIYLVFQLSIALAASPVIGVAIAKGSFQLDSSRTPGNGTLFEGSTVETGKASSELKMASGVRMLLDVGTRSRVYRDYMSLEKGAGQVEHARNYRIRARSLQIQ